MKISQFFTSIMVGIAGISAVFSADAAETQRGVRTVNVGPGTSNSPRFSIVTGGGAGMGGSLTLPGSTATQEKTSPVDVNTIPTITPKETKPTYTVEQCMNELESCINSGALQGGLNDLFNPDVRAAVLSCSGMRLCQNIIDKCLTIENKYTNCEDVWFDFNSRIIQPEYYNFVLRKTGLTPNQAENTCLLLDRNVYGNSFNSVSDGYDVAHEYGGQVNAYNNQGYQGTGEQAGTKNVGDKSTKTNPIGADVNQNYYDMNRGHYARWDATNAECLIRVAAYNKDKPIKNEWLGIGDGKYAETWQRAGSSFSCNKDLFGFSLMNDTKSAALISGVSGVALGTTVGMISGAAIADKKQKEAQALISDANKTKVTGGQYDGGLKGDEDLAAACKARNGVFEAAKTKGGNDKCKCNSKNFDPYQKRCVNGAVVSLNESAVTDPYAHPCKDENFKKALRKNLRGYEYVINSYLSGTGKYDSTGSTVSAKAATSGQTTPQNSNAATTGLDKLTDLTSYGAGNNNDSKPGNDDNNAAGNNNNNTTGTTKKTETTTSVLIEAGKDDLSEQQCRAVLNLYSKANLYKSAVNYCLTGVKYKEVADCLDQKERTHSGTYYYEDMSADMSVCCGIAETRAENRDKLYSEYLAKCNFKPLQLAFAEENAENIFCSAQKECRGALAMQADLNRLTSLLDSLQPTIEPRLKNAASDKGAMIGKGAAIGAAVGVGTAGLATAITAFVERENINCRVGDGLDQVGYGKTLTINSLKDFYTKWNLRLPDRIMPTTHIEDKVQLTTACAQFNSRLTDCPDVQVIYDYYPDQNDKTIKKTTILSNACVVDTGACIPNDKVVKLYNLDNALTLNPKATVNFKDSLDKKEFLNNNLINNMKK